MSRKNISISEAIEGRAQQLIHARGFRGLSDLIDALIREEYERREDRKRQFALQETPTTPPSSKSGVDVSAAVVASAAADVQAGGASGKPPSIHPPKPVSYRRSSRRKFPAKPST